MMDALERYNDFIEYAYDQMNELDDKKYFLSKALVNINTTKIYAWLKYTVNEEKINGGETVLFILGTEWKSGETQHNSK